MSEMGSFLSKMTNAKEDELRFDSNQVNAVVEVMIPRIITDMPGIKHAGLKCRLLEKDETGWTLRIDR